MKGEKAVLDKPSLCVSGGVVLLETPHNKRWSPPLLVFPFGFFLGGGQVADAKKALSCTNGPYSGRNPRFVKISLKFGSLQRKSGNLQKSDQK